MGMPRVSIFAISRRLMRGARVRLVVLLFSMHYCTYLVNLFCPCSQLPVLVTAISQCFPFPIMFSG